MEPLFPSLCVQDITKVVLALPGTSGGGTFWEMPPASICPLPWSLVSHCGVGQSRRKDAHLSRTFHIAHELSATVEITGQKGRWPGGGPTGG
jgi:hypothetical protein